MRLLTPLRSVMSISCACRSTRSAWIAALAAVRVLAGWRLVFCAASAGASAAAGASAGRVPEMTVRPDSPSGASVPVWCRRASSRSLSAMRFPLRRHAVDQVQRLLRRLPDAGVAVNAQVFELGAARCRAERAECLRRRQPDLPVAVPERIADQRDGRPRADPAESAAADHALAPAAPLDQHRQVADRGVAAAQAGGYREGRSHRWLLAFAESALYEEVGSAASELGDEPAVGSTSPDREQKR